MCVRNISSFFYLDHFGPHHNKCVSLSLSLFHREAVRQRKALSRTSSNILLNSVQMGHHNPNNVNQYHHISYNHPSDCDINSKLKDLKEEDSLESVSNIEVIGKSHFSLHGPLDLRPMSHMPCAAIASACHMYLAWHMNFVLFFFRVQFPVVPFDIVIAAPTFPFYFLILFITLMLS